MPTNFHKRHYEAIAQAIKEVVEWHTANPKEYNYLPHTIALNLADMLQQDNPHFKRALFMAACGTPD